MNDTAELISDIKRMLGRMGMDTITIDQRIKDALMGVLAEGLGARVSAPVQHYPTIRLPPTDPQNPLNGPTVVVRPELPASQGGKFFRGTGKYAMDDKGERVEIGTWMNPAGESDAARLTKETGVMHFVNAKTGDVESVGMVSDKLASAAPAPASPAMEVIGGPTAVGMLPS